MWSVGVEEPSRKNRLRVGTMLLQGRTDVLSEGHIASGQMDLRVSPISDVDNVLLYHLSSSSFGME